MDFFFMILSAALTLGFCWLTDHESFSYHVASVFLLETCVAFWIVLPK